MAAKSVTKDPHDPAFPHGEHRGYWRGCKCERCLQAHAKARKVGEAVRAGAVTPMSTSRIDSTRVRTHLQALTRLDIPRRDIAVAAGVTTEVLANLLDRGQKTVSVRVATALLAVNRDAANAAARIVDNRMTVVRCRAMQALGWPLTWQAREAGIGKLSREHYQFGHRCRARDAAAIKALADRIGDRQPHPARDGMPTRAISVARTCARRGGWYTPMFYDDNGNLIQEALVDQSAVTPRYREHCRRYVAMVALTLQGMSAERVGRQIGVEARSVQRVRALVALDQDYVGQPLDPAHFECVRQVVADADLPAAGIFGSEAPEVIWARLEQLTAAAVASAA